MAARQRVGENTGAVHVIGSDAGEEVWWCEDNGEMSVYTQLRLLNAVARSSILLQHFKPLVFLRLNGMPMHITQIRPPTSKLAIILLDRLFLLALRHSVLGGGLALFLPFFVSF